MNENLMRLANKKLFSVLVLIAVLFAFVGNALAAIPPTPTSVTAAYQSTSGKVRVTVSGTGAGLAGATYWEYHVYSVTTSSYAYTHLTSPSNPFDIALTVNQTYRIEVANCNASGCSSYRNSANVSVPDVTAKMHGCLTSVAGTSITTSWNKGAPCISTASTLQWQGYYYQRNSDNLVYGNVTGNPTSHTLSGLAEGTYTLNYGCVDQSPYTWSGALSSSGDCIYLTATIVLAPTAPSGLTATSQVKPTGTDFRVSLTWTDNSNNETGFQVYRNSSLIATLGANVTSYIDAAASTPGTTYSYYVRAYNASGGNDSNTANVTHAAIAAPVLNAPTMTAGAGGWRISLTWTDKSSNEANFEVYKNGVKIATLGAGVTSYVDTDTASSTARSYYVRAVTAAGQGANSNTVNITTGSAPNITSASCTPNSIIVGGSTTCTVSATDPNGGTYGSLAYLWTTSADGTFTNPNATSTGLTYSTTGSKTANIRVCIGTSGVCTNQNVSVTVSTCTYSISPTSASPSASGGSLSVSVTASNSACTWTSTSNNAWITVTSGASGTGNGTVTLSVAANTGVARTGTVTIAGNTYTVNQAVSTYTITPSATTGGTINPSTPVTVNYGEGHTFNMTANTGYVLWDVLVDGSSVGAVNPYTFSNVTSNRTIQALFATTPTITSVSCTPSTFNHGSSTTCTVSATDPHNGAYGGLTYQWMTSSDGIFTAPNASTTELEYSEPGTKTATVRVCIGTTGLCETAVTCPLGGTYNTSTMKCEYQPNMSCLTGYTYNSTTQKCEVNPTCPSGSTYNASTARCETTMNPCPTGYTYNSTTQKCEVNPTCPSGGSYNTTSDVCRATASTTCVSGYTYNSTTQKCEVNPTCPSGGSYNTTSDVCRATASTTCVSGYTYNSTTQKCEANPTCPSDSTYNASTNRCEAVLSSNWQCSANSQTYSTQSACLSACSQTANCTAGGTIFTSQVGNAGIQTQGGNIRIFGGGMYGQWIPVNAGGTYYTSGPVSSLPFFANIAINTQYGTIWFSENYLGGYSVPVTGSGSSIVRCTGIELNNGMIRVLYQWYEQDPGYCSGPITYGDWIPLNPTYSCPLGNYPCTGTPPNLTCSISGTCTQNNTCPAGFTQSGSVCIATATCPSGGTLNGTTDKCELNGSVTCPTGYTYNSSTGFCQVSATCPSGGTLNGTTDKCESTITPCPTGFTLSGTTCWSNPVCLAGGTFNAAVHKCQGSPIITCPAGSYDGNLCIALPEFGCPNALTCVNRDISLTVNPFVEVKKGGTGSGTVTSTPAGINCGATCKAYYNLGGNVTLTATPASGSSFSGWSDGCTGTGSCTLTMSGNKTVSANFEACTYSIEPINGSAPASGGNLSVSVTASHSSCPWTSTSNNAWITVTSGASGTGNGTVTLSVSANTGVARTGTVTIAGHTFTVNQAVSTYTITPSATTGGTIDPSTPVTVNYGEGHTFNMTANTGAYLYDVLIDGASVGVINPYTFENVTSNRTIKAMFAVAPEIASMACTPNPVLQNAQANCSVTALNPNVGWGTFTYQWMTSSDGIFTAPNASTTELEYSEPGTKTVIAKVCFAENPALCSERGIVVQAAIVPPQITSITCPESLWQGQTGECSASATAQWGTVKYQWFVMPDGTITDDTTANPSVMFMTAGNKTVRVRAYIEEATHVFSEQSVTVRVNSAAPTIHSITCPATAYTNQNVRCTADATIPFGEITYSWMTNWDGTINADGNTADIVYTNAGTKSIVVEASRADMPTLSHTRIQTINIKHFDLNASIDCVSNSEPLNTFYQLRPLTCTLTFNNPDELPGTPTITWTTSADGAITGQGNTVEVTYNLAGGKIITANISFSETPDVVIKTRAINIVSSVPNITTLVCPVSLFRNTVGECNATATSPWGTISYEWSIDKGTVTADGSSAQISSSVTGTRAVDIKATIDGYPQLSKTRRTYVRIDSVYPPSLTLNIPTQVIRNTPVTLTATAVSSQGNVKVTWEIDGQVYEGLSVNLTPTEVRQYDIKATAVVEGYEDDPTASVVKTGKLTVTTMPKPIISIYAPFTIMQNQTIEITGSITSNHEPVVTKWTLPDGSEVSNTLTTSYTFNTSGTQQIKLTAHVEGYDRPEEVAEVTKSVLVRAYQFPDFRIRTFGSTQGYAPFFTYFMAETNVSITQLAGATFTYHWDLGDGNTFTSRNSRVVTHTYQQPGVYTVTLTVTDIYDQTKTDSTTVTVLEAPPINIEFRVISTNRYNRVPFIVVVTPRITGGHPLTDRIVKYEWTLNGEPVGRPTSIASIPLTVAGEHTIGLTVTTRSGKTATGTTKVMANENKPPVCDFIYTDYPQYKYTKLVSKCIDPDGRIVRYHWDLGDGTTSILNVAFPKYTESGTYTVTLTATDDSGASVTITKPVTVTR